MVLVMVGTGALLTAGAFEAWIFARLRDQQRRLGHRLDAVKARLDAGASRSTSGATTMPAPAFSLVALDGSRVTPASLVASGRPALVMFTDPRCGPCYELLPDIGGWQRVYGDRLTFALVSAGDAATNQAMTAEYGIGAGTVLLQDEREVAEAFGVQMAPAALLLQPDGRIAGETVYGAPAVRQLVANALGLALPPAPERHLQASRRGELAPPFRRPDLSGLPVELTAAGGAQTLLLFWSPGCDHCAALLPEMKQWEASPAGPRLVVVSRGPVALNQEAGLASPVILDDDRSLTDAYGVRGTPAAVLIDERGFIATDVARGERAVRALASRTGART